MTEEMKCAWEVDHRNRRPVLCGKPAKAMAVENPGNDKAVCGVHVRSAKALGYDVEPLPGPDVRVGQVWQDADPRSAGRLVRVTEVGATHAEVAQVDKRGIRLVNGRSGRIRLDRFRLTSTGYRLVRDVPKES